MGKKKGKGNKAKRGGLRKRIERLVAKALRRQRRKKGSK